MSMVSRHVTHSGGILLCPQAEKPFDWPTEGGASAAAESDAEAAALERSAQEFLAMAAKSMTAASAEARCMRTHVYDCLCQ